ncbi:hypothetical protein LOK49_LG06G00300 [Camellia lanceoleosa]|uniref:Uncharacterized protein n=1 Tax=Camellia lanceoleosa TaxID=1840588 RepID=A0ACC0HB28_9ERIC|nr:hypothetical protein LOK49_LG06G00300 [Camellia lanceoleosa]
MKPSTSISLSLRFGTSLMWKVKRCFTCNKPTESASGSKERYKGKMSCNLSETTSCGDGGYSEMIQNAISYCKDSLIKGDTKANETPIEEPETEAKVLDIPSPCSMDIDSQTSNQLPQVINGVPKGLRIEDVLGRIAVLLLIRDKVANFEYIDEVEAAAEEEARKASTENKLPPTTQIELATGKSR